MENPHLRWMITMGTPISGNLQMHELDSDCAFTVPSASTAWASFSPCTTSVASIEAANAPSIGANLFRNAMASLPTMRYCNYWNLHRTSTFFCLDAWSLAEAAHRSLRQLQHPLQGRHLPLYHWTNVHQRAFDTIPLWSMQSQLSGTTGPA